MAKNLQLSTDAALATITLNRPDKRNALSFELLDELMSALALARHSPPAWTWRR
jgi:enoyl-CoA hydratase/carnithine racemase